MSSDASSTSSRERASINDAAALVTARVAVTAAVAGSFSLASATLEFVAATVGGVAVGLAVGWGIRLVRRRIDDPLTTITVSLLTGYAAYVPAEALHLSGVLATVTAGVYLGWRSHELAAPGVRLQATAVWEVLIVPAQRHPVHPRRAATASRRRRSR